MSRLNRIPRLPAPRAPGRLARALRGLAIWWTLTRVDRAARDARALAAGIEEDEHVLRLAHASHLAPDQAALLRRRVLDDKAALLARENQLHHLAQHLDDLYGQHAANQPTHSAPAQRHRA